MNWPLVKLGDLCVVKRGTTITQKEAIEGKVPVVSGGLKPTYFHNSSNRNGNTITVSGSGASAGFINFYKEPIFASDCSTVEPKNDTVDVSYIYRAMQNLQEYIYTKLKAGAAQPHVYAKDLANLEIPFPPLAEQHRIAALLDTADHIIKQRELAIAKLDQLAQSVFVEMFGDVVSNNKNWNQLCINEIAANEKYSIVDGPFGSSLKPTDYLETGVPVIRIANVTKDGYFLPKNLLYISKEKFKELKRSSVCGDDVLVTRVGTIGNTCIFPNNFGDALLSTTGVCKIKPNRELVMPSYLHASIKTKSFQAQINKSASTSVQKYFNLTALKSWKISIPPLHLQNEFIKKINLINDEITKHQQCLHQIKNLEFSLQHQSFAVN